MNTPKGHTDPDWRERYRQKRRRPRKKREPNEEGVKLSAEIERVFDLVPEIGEGRRWYDLPYRMLSWLSSGWRRRFLPERARRAVNNGINNLFQYNEHDRDKAWSLDDWMHNICVPDDEHVTVAGLWVVELFPPSQLPAFERSLNKNGWKHSRWGSLEREDNPTILQQARSGKGMHWWRLVDVAQKDSKLWNPDAIRSELPSEFEWIELRAVQIGAGLTAIVAHFTLTESAASSLDREWHRPHEPIMVREGHHNIRRRSLDRQWAAFHETQAVRRSLHDAARDWMAEQVPGYFAANDSPQLLLDLMLLEQHDPATESYVEPELDDARKLSDALRAIGLPDHEAHQIVSPSLEKLVLTENDPRMHPTLGDGPLWTLWGNRGAITEAWKRSRHSRLMGDNIDRAVAHRVESAYFLMIMLAVSEFLEISAQRYAEIRDRATTRHGQFKAGALRDLRQNFLTLSLDLATVSREAAVFWGEDRKWMWDGAHKFVYELTPSARANHPNLEDAGGKPRSFIERVRKLQDQRLEALVTADREYRDILSSVASLGASADAFKIGRWALWVALASLAVAIATIVLADVGCNSVIHQIVGWPSPESCQVSPSPDD
ncbi:hypothetical protein [Cellulosimicrobium sp. Marseille-Q8652]